MDSEEFPWNIPKRYLIFTAWEKWLLILNYHFHFSTAEMHIFPNYKIFS